MPLTIVCSDDIKGYDFGPGHPFRSDRLGRPRDCRHRNLRGLSLEDKQQPMDTPQLKVWIDGNTIE